MRTRAHLNHDLVSRTSGSVCPDDGPYPGEALWGTVLSCKDLEIVRKTAGEEPCDYFVMLRKNTDCPECLALRPSVRADETEEAYAKREGL